MTDPSLAVLARVAEFLTGLTAAEVTELAAGRARLALLPTPPPPAGPPTLAGPPSPAQAAPPVPAASPVPTASVVDPAVAHAALTVMSRRDEGTAYLASWTARELRALATHAGLRGIGGLRKADLIDRIVDRTIGYRLNSTAIRQR
ncbi:Rho termination factor N-terminal domain-containing protein [Micromonospora sp. R77]|uniref:Rho termination factor N-terminal domain-containing protein n=1 Tax=Micromonospora sp. R77 TaxID=2925836 RepID=UPI001F6099EB|nr:Rho termination factor N-terminal domain-containing protein [Micromonospora sp. R77]MCI4064538.1 Rho termination factor N-terminal domain-containing protein [Micromonospora sp. R77]